MHRYRRLIPYIAREWPRLALIGLMTVLTSMLAALQPWPLKILVDYGLGEGETPAGFANALRRVSLEASPIGFIALAAGASLGIFLLSSLLSAGITWTWAVAGQRMIRGLATDVFARMQRLSLGFHQRYPVGELLSRLTTDTWAIYKVANEIMIGPAQRVFTFLAVGIVAWQLSPRLAAFSLVTAPLVAAAAFFFGKPLKKRARLGREARSRLLSFVHQTLSSIPVVQAFATESQNWERYQDLADDAVTLSQRTTLLTSSYGLVTGLITSAGTALIIFVGGGEVLAGTLSVGSFIVFISYLRTMQKSATGLLKLYGTLKPVEASIDRVVEVLDSEEVVSEVREPKSLPEGGPCGRVRFESVTFGYKDGRPVLHGVTLDASPGETVAIVGPTGSGKSTLLTLIPRFYDPWEGRVTLDGVDLRELRLADLRSRIAVVLQEPMLFPGTIAENIAFGRPEATREEIEAAARAANAEEFIERLPEGYDSIVGERGATLSGGEGQRLSIARAVLKDAPVLLLDEPTSALDAETEAGVVEALDRLMQGRTTLLVAHRLSTIRNAQRIVVLSEGRVVESGTHDGLMAERGAYWRLYAQQMQEVPAL